MATKKPQVVRTTGMKRVMEGMQELPVELTDADVIARATSLAHLEDAERKSTLEFDKHKSAHKAEVERIAEERSRLLRAIRDREEPRPVKIEGWAMFETRLYEERRIDTGEVINTRALLNEELQDDLFDQPEGS